MLAWGISAPAAAASNWNSGLVSGSAAEAAAQALPAPPSPTAACTGLIGGIKVTWGAVAHASAYTVYQSTTSSTSGFSVVASGVTTLSYTQSGLGLGSYWFKVATSIGTNWLGPMSASTAQKMITLVLCT